MKNKIIIILFMSGQTILFAQTKPAPISFTYAEFRGGYGVNIFGNGLREKYSAGNFSTSAGGLASLAAYHKFKKINYLNFGIKYKSLGAALTVKYFPFDRIAKKGVYLQGDYFFVTQFTQKYRTTTKLQFDHQFAIGSGLAFGVGYDIPFGNKKTMLTFGVEYESASRQGEVTGLGDKKFKSSNFGIMTGIKF